MLCTLLFTVVGGYFCEVATWMTGRIVYKHENIIIPKPIKPFCTLPHQAVEGLKIRGKLLALCVIIKCFITKCFITAFLLPEMIKVLISHEDVKFIAIYCEI